MIYKCKWCGSEITHLETDGDEVCEDFVCPECAEQEWEICHGQDEASTDQ